MKEEAVVDILVMLEAKRKQNSLPERKDAACLFDSLAYCVSAVLHWN